MIKQQKQSDPRLHQRKRERERERERDLPVSASAPLVETALEHWHQTRFHSSSSLVLRRNQPRRSPGRRTKCPQTAVSLAIEFFSCLALDATFSGNQPIVDLVESSLHTKTRHCHGLLLPPAPSRFRPRHKTRVPCFNLQSSFDLVSSSVRNTVPFATISHSGVYVSTTSNVERSRPWPVAPLTSEGSGVTPRATSTISE